jgi:hypothetical protein
LFDARRTTFDCRWINRPRLETSLIQGKQTRLAGGVSPVEESLWPSTLSPATVVCRRARGTAAPDQLVSLTPLKIPAAARSSTCVFLTASNHLFTAVRRISRPDKNVEKGRREIADLKNNPG